MSARVYEVTQYSAYCVEHGWEGGVYDDVEQLADEDATAHNTEFHNAVQVL